jgi:transcription elongation factor Elf1
MKIAANWTCPTCGAVNITLHDVENRVETNVVYCDVAVGGCNEMFVVETERRAEITAVYSLKSEAIK